MNIIFLDIDGVLNCELFFKKRQADIIADYEQQPHPANMLCPERIDWFNDLCKKADCKVVISSTWRMSGLNYCEAALKLMGADFEIIGMTPLSKHGVRGVEIQDWIKLNTELLGKEYYDFYTYVIIDDDSDMLKNQAEHFFQTDTYSGLTPNTCYRIERFFKKFKQ